MIEIVLTEGASLDYMEIPEGRFATGLAMVGVWVLFSEKISFLGMGHSFLGFEFLMDLDFLMEVGFFGRVAGEFVHSFLMVVGFFGRVAGEFVHSGKGTALALVPNPKVPNELSAIVFMVFSVCMSFLG